MARMDKTLRVAERDLQWAAEQGLIAPEQAIGLWQALCQRDQQAGPDATDAAVPPARFDFLHLAYYAGAMLVILAMTFFMSLAWESFGGAGIFFISALYALVFVLLGQRLFKNPSLRVPAGLLVTMAVCMTPLLVYGLQRWTGLWGNHDPGAYRGFYQWIKGGWFFMEVATVASGVIALRHIRFPFLTMPVAFVLWFMSMDLSPLLFGEDVSFRQRAEVSAAVGAAMLLAAYLVDRRTREDLAYWGYLFGMLAFWGGLSSMKSDSQLNKLVYCLINVGLMFLSILLERRVFLIFGALGVFGYLGYLAYDVFAKSVLFPFALSGFGLAIILLAVQYHKRRLAIEAAILSRMPPWLLRALPRSRPAPRS